LIGIYIAALIITVADCVLGLLSTFSVYPLHINLLKAYRKSDGRPGSEPQLKTRNAIDTLANIRNILVILSLMIALFMVVGIKGIPTLLLLISFITLLLIELLSTLVSFRRQAAFPYILESPDYLQKQRNTLGKLTLSKTLRLIILIMYILLTRS